MQKDKNVKKRVVKNRNGISVLGDVERGFTTLENYVIKLPFLSPICRSILYAFFMYQNCQETFISYNTLRRYTGITSYATISKYLKFLNWIDFISIQRFFNEDGTKYNVYKINHNRIADFYKYMEEMNLTFIEIEDYWKKNARETKDADKLLEEPDSFVNALKEILNTINEKNV